MLEMTHRDRTGHKELAMPKLAQCGFAARSAVYDHRDPVRVLSEKIAETLRISVGIQHGGFFVDLFF